MCQQLNSTWFRYKQTHISGLFHSGWNVAPSPMLSPFDNELFTLIEAVPSRYYKDKSGTEKIARVQTLNSAVVMWID